jgi:hypothetical protein
MTYIISERDKQLEEDLMLSYLQIDWLDSYGGRTEDDLRADDDGLYVEMSMGGNAFKKKYMPSIKKLLDLKIKELWNR